MTGIKYTRVSGGIGTSAGEQSMQLTLQFLIVASFPLVDDHQVDHDLPVAPIGMSTKELAHQAGFLVAADPCQQDRIVA